MHPTGNTRLLERMVAQGLIKAEQREAVLNHQQRMGGRVEEALLEVKAIDEATMLKFIASLYRTRFVTTDKLAKADIDRATLERVPKKLAEESTLFPVVLDAKGDTLSVVTPDPDNQQALQDLQVASGVRKINAYVGRPAAVRAAINKHYNGDIHAFANLDQSAQEHFSSMLDVYERNVLSEETMAVALAGEQTQERVLDAGDLQKAGSGVGMGARGMASASYLETLNVLVSLLENGRADLRGHSSQTARLMKKIAERIGVGELEAAAYQIAAYMHDLGKMSAYHLTALNVAEYEGHKAAADKSYKAPLRMLEAVELPSEARKALSSMYERYDGKGGVPGESSGKDIFLGARLLAIVDTYADLTQNPRNPFRKTLRPVQACEVLAKFKGSVFDPNLVDLFKHTVTGDDLKARLLANRNLALVVDPDPEETTVLELRLIEQGFEVRIARAADQAFKILESGDVEVVISELALKPQDGFALLAEARKNTWGKDLPWVIVTSSQAAADAKKAFDLGASDFMTKPVATDLLVAKLKQIMEREARQRAPRGVSGSLTEMGLPEIVQVLWHGRKTGSLKIRRDSDQGEIHFVEGAIYNAMYGNLRGQEAFYAMVTLTEGDFNLDPSFKAPQQVIQESPESLLLEGMRRLDESAARVGA